jgi:hypothetical protein
MRLQDDMAEDPVEAARKGLQPNIGVYLENKLRKPLESIFEYVVVSQSEEPLVLPTIVETPSLAVLATGRNLISIGTVNIAGVSLENGVVSFPLSHRWGVAKSTWLTALLWSLVIEQV